MARRKLSPGSAGPEQSVKQATTKWPSGDHVADLAIRDGALVVSIDFSGLADEALEYMSERARQELDDRKGIVASKGATP